jgi:glyoxylase-like metal-dependent hydrolase (beta-lactamase superfamily II)
VKKSHRDLVGPVATRVAAIVTDPSWTPWMPVTSYAIEHPDGVFLVDTGLTEDMLDSQHFACDPGTSFVYGNLLQFQFAPEDRIDRRLASLGLSTAQVKGVVLTHRHADHTDGLRLLPSAATIYVGEGDWPAHNGALVCQWPAGRVPVIVADDRREAFGALPSSLALTKDRALRVVPLPGHSPGHLGVVLEAGSEWVLFAGDSVFDLDQLAKRRIAGISEVPAAALDSLDRIAKQLAFAPTTLLPAHDPQSLERFARGAVTPSGEQSPNIE